MSKKEHLGNKNKEIVITGKTVLRGVQVLIALFSLYSLVQTIVFGREMDTLPLLMMAGSLFILEVSLSDEKDLKHEQDN